MIEVVIIAKGTNRITDGASEMSVRAKIENVDFRTFLGSQLYSIEQSGFLFNTHSIYTNAIGVLESGERYLIVTDNYEIDIKVDRDVT